MHPDKAPGLDGLNPGFFQNHWDINGDKVTLACLDFLNKGHFPSSLNTRNLVLIQETKRNPLKLLF